MTDSISQTLARFVAGTRYESIPEHTRQMAKRCLLDGLGVSLAATGLAEAELQRISSHLSVTIGAQRLFLQPLFVYPAVWTSQSLKDFIERSEPLAPFRFQNQNFKRWVSPRNKGRDRLLRLEPDWRQHSESH